MTGPERRILVTGPYLYMADGVLAGDGDCVLGTDDRDLVKDGVSDGLLDVFHLVNGLLVGEAVQEKIKIGSRAELVVVVLSELSLRDLEVGGDRQKTVDNRGTSRNDIAPVHFDERRFREDVEVVLKLGEARDGGRRLVRPTLFVGESHDVLGLFLIGLCRQASGTGRDELCVLGEKGSDIDVRIVEDGILSILSVELPQASFIPAVGRYDVSHWLLRVLGNVSDELPMRSGQLRETRSGHDCGR